MSERPPKPYSPFHPELDAQFPLAEMFGKENLEFLQAIASGAEERPSTMNLSWGSAFRMSPMQNAEAEWTMGRFCEEAARQGQWIDLPVQKDKHVIEEIPLPGGEKIVIGYNVDFERGGKLLVQEGFAALNKDPEYGGQYLAPTAKMLEFIRSRLRPGASKGK